MKKVVDFLKILCYYIKTIEERAENDKSGKEKQRITRKTLKEDERI